MQNERSNSSLITRQVRFTYMYNKAIKSVNSFVRTVWWQGIIVLWSGRSARSGTACHSSSTCCSCRRTHTHKNCKHVRVHIHTIILMYNVCACVSVFARNLKATKTYLVHCTNMYVKCRCLFEDVQFSTKYVSDGFTMHRHKLINQQLSCTLSSV